MQIICDNQEECCLYRAVMKFLQHQRKISPGAALNLWKGSSGHNAVMTRSGTRWSIIKTMGVAIVEGTHMYGFDE